MLAVKAIGAMIGVAGAFNFCSAVLTDKIFNLANKVLFTHGSFYHAAPLDRL